MRLYATAYFGHSNLYGLVLRKAAEGKQPSTLTKRPRTTPTKGDSAKTRVCTSGSPSKFRSSTTAANVILSGQFKKKWGIGKPQQKLLDDYGNISKKRNVMAHEPGPDWAEAMLKCAEYDPQTWAPYAKGVDTFVRMIYRRSLGELAEGEKWSPGKYLPKLDF